MAFRLLHVNVLLDIGLQESSFDICLLHRPIEARSQADDDADCNKFCSWDKSFFVVNPFDLSEAARDESGLVLNDVAFHVLFDLVNPLAGDDIGMRWAGDQVLDLFVREQLDFVKFRLLPFFRER